jgi:hypothetical protein
MAKRTHRAIGATDSRYRHLQRYQFKAGVSGNPKGRPKGRRNRLNHRVGLDKLVEIMDSKRTPAAVQLWAAKIFIEASPPFLPINSCRCCEPLRHRPSRAVCRTRRIRHPRGRAAQRGYLECGEKNSIVTGRCGRFRNSDEGGHGHLSGRTCQNRNIIRGQGWSANRRRTTTAVWLAPRQRS